MPRDLFADLDHKDLLEGIDINESNGLPAEQRVGLAERLGFTGKRKGLGEIFGEDIQTGANSPGIHGIQGAQDATRELMTLGLVPITPQGQGTAYNIGKGIGDVAGFLGGGELADAARVGVAASKTGKIPGFKQGLSALEESPLVKRLLGATAFGAIANPEDRGTGALTGLGLGGIGEAALGAKNLLPKVLENFKPHRQAEEILLNLGKGSSPSEVGEGVLPAKSEDIINALNNNAKSVAKDVQNKYKEVTQLGSEKYDSIFNNPGVGTRRIPLPEMERKTALVEGIPSVIPKRLIESFDSKTENLYKDFLSDPSVKNAHDLQSQLGFKERELQRQHSAKGLQIADQKILDDYKKAKTSVQKLIHKELKSVGAQQGSDYLSPYLEANKFHYENVTPYNHPLISKMAKGDINNPRNLSNIFKNPEEDIQKIVEDLGDDFKHKILFSELGKLKGKNLTTDKLLKGAEDLDKKGLNEYITPQLQEQLDTLRKKSKNKEIAKRAAGIIGGGAVGSLLPVPYAKELGGALGFMAAPAIEKALSAILTKKGF